MSRCLPVVLAAVVMMLVPTAFANGLTLGPAEDIGPAASSATSYTGPRVLVDGAGVTTVVWYSLNGPTAEIAARRTAPGGWAPRLPVAQVGDPGGLWAAIDAVGVVTAAWIDRTAPVQLSSARFSGAWGPATALSAPGESVVQAAVAAGPAGTAVAAWTTRGASGYVVKARWLSGGAWGPEQIVGSQRGAADEATLWLVMDGAGVATLAMSSSGGPNETYARVSRGQGVFPAPALLPGGVRVGRFDSFDMAVAASGAVTLWAPTNTADQPGVVWQHIGGSWSSPVGLPVRGRNAGGIVVYSGASPLVTELHATAGAPIDLSFAVTPLGTSGQTTWPAAWSATGVLDVGAVQTGADAAGVVTIGMQVIRASGESRYELRQWSPASGPQPVVALPGEGARVGGVGVAPDGTVTAATPIGGSLLVYRSAPSVAAGAANPAATAAAPLCSETFYQQAKRTIRWDSRRKAYKVVSRIRVFNDAQSRCRTKLSIIYRNANTKVSLAQKPGSSLGYRKLKGKNFNAPVISWPNKKEMRFTTGDISGQNRKNARLVLVSYVKKTKAVPKKLRDIELVIVRRIPRNPAAAKSGSNPLFAQKNSFRAGKAWAGVS